jgi:hypothetical protein
MKMCRGVEACNDSSASRLGSINLEGRYQATASEDCEGFMCDVVTCVSVQYIQLPIQTSSLVTSDAWQYRELVGTGLLCGLRLLLTFCRNGNFQEVSKEGLNTFWHNEE